MAAPTWPSSRQIVFDSNGIRAPGAKAYFFDAGTTSPRTTYQDAALATPHTHPVVADANGRWPRVFLQFGGYAERVTTASGSQLWNDDGIDEPAPFDDAQAVDPNNLVKTGTTMWMPFDGIEEGYVRMNGRTIGNASSSATERANADTEDLFTKVYNNIADAQAPVSGGRGASAAADFAANKTIALPDIRGGGPLGLDTMGNSAGSFFTGLTFDHGDETTPGSAVGENAHALTEAELASHTHTNGTLATAAGGGHTPTTQPAGAATTLINEPSSNILAQAGSSQGVSGQFSAVVENTALDHNHVMYPVPDHTHSLTGTVATTGSGTAHTNVSRKVLGTWYIKL